MQEQTANPAHLAINFILTNASKFAEAKATRVQLEEYRKSKKAILMSEEDGTVLLVNDDGSVGASISTPTDDREPCAY